MIDKTEVVQFVEERIEELNSNLFWVSVDIGVGNTIKVVLDGDKGVTIEQCISVSRNIEHSLDRESEDFSLEVASFGLTQALILERQFMKYIGKSIEVVDNDQEKFIGKLISYIDGNIVIEMELTKKQIKAGVEPVKSFDKESIKEVKSVISFK
ncbi:MAG: ribosome assembly cofactor RimP [Bacteroidetes bacterium]|nr:MAG: ribosome assembly cofactor RimP [Bacteroidota bacterium]